MHDVFFLLSGMVELIDSRTGLHNRKSAGSFIGELDCFGNGKARRTCRALSAVSALRIPCEIFMEFLRRTGVRDSLRNAYDNRQILQGSWLFGEMVSFPLQIRIARRNETAVPERRRRDCPGGPGRDPPAGRRPHVDLPRSPADREPYPRRLLRGGDA